MRFASLGSGSKGNATLVECGATCVMVDCGFSVAEVDRRLERLGRNAASLDGLLVTHEHGDHIRGIGPLARKYGLPVWMTAGTAAAHGDARLPDLRRFNGHDAFRIGELEIQPFPVPHDAREPCQFVFLGAGRKLGLLTDVGSLTRHIHTTLHDCDALILECNHDEQLLADGPYPPALKRRVGGRFGHLSNRQAARLLAELDHSRLHHLVVAHISEQNNTREHALEALRGVLESAQERIHIADQETGFPWCDLCPAGV